VISVAIKLYIVYCFSYLNCFFLLATVLLAAKLYCFAFVCQQTYLLTYLPNLFVFCNFVVNTVNNSLPPCGGVGWGCGYRLRLDRTYYCNILPCSACVALADVSVDMFYLMLHLNAELVLCR